MYIQNLYFVKILKYTVEHFYKFLKDLGFGVKKFIRFGFGQLRDLVAY